MLYQVGHEHHLLWAAQDARRVGPRDLGTPAPIVADKVIGPGPAPITGVSQNQARIHVAGQGAEADWQIGRYERQLSVTWLPTDPAFLNMALRNHDIARTQEPPYGTSPSILGLPYFTLEDGIADATVALQHVDCLVHALSLDYDEGQPMRATADIWPICAINITPNANPPASSGDIFTWAQLDVELNSASFRDICQRVGVRLRHNLVRKGCRPATVSGGALTPLACAPRRITPTRQELDVLLHLYALDYDRLPARWAWGDLKLRASRPDGAEITVLIDGQRLAEATRPMAPPGSIVTYTTSTQANVITITG